MIKPLTKAELKQAGLHLRYLPTTDPVDGHDMTVVMVMVTVRDVCIAAVESANKSLAERTALKEARVYLASGRAV